MTTSTMRPLNNPYVGPRTFSYADRLLYFGREREARTLLARVISARLLLFYAQSGAGKSSLINTRLIPQLREEEDFSVLPVGRVSGQLPADVVAVDNLFIFNLLASLDQSGSNPARLTHLTLTEFLAHLFTDDGLAWRYEPLPTVETLPAPLPAANEAATATRFALIIDQFEEIFTTHPERWQEREGFFRQLEAALQANPNLWVVLTLREDYVAALDPYAPLLFNRLRARFYMERMDVNAALEAIQEPAIRYGRPFAPGVADVLVQDLSRIKVLGQATPQPGQYVEPVQLQVVCYQLWENLAQQRPLTGTSAGEDKITAGDLAAAGDVDTALARFYEATVASALAAAETPVSERQLRTWFDSQLITPTGTRGLVLQGATETGGLPNAIVRQLQARFLVRSESRAGGAWVELVHDRFVEPIQHANRQWLARNLNPLTQAAQVWQATGRDRHLLYSGLALKDAMVEIERSPEVYGDLEGEFLDAGRAEEGRRAAQRRYWQGVAVIALAAVLLVLTAWALRSQSKAWKSQAAAVAETTRSWQAEATARSDRAIAQEKADLASKREAEARSANTEVAHQYAVAVAALGTAEEKRRDAEFQRQKAKEEQQKVATLAWNLGVVLTSQAATAAWIHTSDLTTFATPVLSREPDSTLVTIPMATLTPTPTPNLAGTETVVAVLAQLSQVQATQTAAMTADIAQPAATSQQPPSGTEFPLSIGYTTERLNLREGPGTEYPRIALLPPGIEVQVVDEQGEWLQVMALGQTGFVNRSYVSSQPTASLITSPASMVQQIAQQKGYEYIWDNGSATVTSVRIVQDTTEVSYDHKNGQLTGIFRQEQTGAWTLSGTWAQDNGKGNFELTFNSDFTEAEGWWNLESEPNTRHNHSLKIVQLTAKTVMPPLSTVSRTLPTGQLVFTVSSIAPNVRDDALFVMKANGDERRLLVSNGLLPSYSPYADLIAYTKWVGINTRLYAIRSSGGQTWAIDDQQWDNWEPSISPRGDRVAFVSSRDKQGWEIYVNNTDGSRLIRLTDEPENSYSPNWSPDGSRIVFTSEHSAVTGHPEIWVMNTDGSNKSRLTNNEASDNYPVWSPDSLRIAFISDRDGIPNVYVMNEDGSDQRRITNSQYVDHYPVWSPDGRWLAYDHNMNGQADLYLVSVDGSQLIQLTDDTNTNEWDPLWLP